MSLRVVPSTKRRIARVHLTAERFSSSRCISSADSSLRLCIHAHEYLSSRFLRPVTTRGEKQPTSAVNRGKEDGEGGRDLRSGSLTLSSITLDHVSLVSEANAALPEMIGSPVPLEGMMGEHWLLASGGRASHYEEVKLLLEYIVEEPVVLRLRSLYGGLPCRASLGRVYRCVVSHFAQVPRGQIIGGFVVFVGVFVRGWHPHLWGRLFLAFRREDSSLQDASFFVGALLFSSMMILNSMRPSTIRNKERGGGRTRNAKPYRRKWMDRRRRSIVDRRGRATACDRRLYK